jgi:acyl-CoA synthetase (AMP-forming)/AMP-acid ligase II/acyl carrier protein
MNKTVVSSAGTVIQQILDHATQAPQALALVAPDRAPLTYARLFVQIQQTIETLYSCGVRRNDRVVIVLPNGPEMAVATLAVTAGATAAPMNPAHCREEFDLGLLDIQARALIVQADTDSPARSVAHAHRIPIIELSSLNAEAGLFTLNGEAGSRSGDWQLPAPSDVALALHTSGTTARPKLVSLTHANLWHSAHNIGTALALAADDRCLNVMPLFLIHGLVGALLASLSAGGSVVCTPGFHAEEFFSWLKQFCPTWYTAVPTMHRAVLSVLREKPAWFQNSSLRFIRSCSVALPTKLAEELEKDFGVPVIEAYGMTEAAHQISSNPLPPKKRKRGSVGLPMGAEIAVVDVDGNRLSPGRTGEITVRGAGVIEGYLDGRGNDQESFTRGWFRTGDQGYLDDDGYLFITGRLKEIINRGGEKIAPAEIDPVLLEHPKVADVATFSIPHSTLGEDVAAAIALKPGTSVAEQEIQDFARLRLAEFKVPRRIVIVDQIPRAVTGKIQRTKLTRAFGNELTVNHSGAVSALEATVARIYAEVLGVKVIGRTDNFFHLGGDSLRGMQVLSRIRERFHINLPIVAVFRSPTVAELSSEIAQLVA